MIKKLNIIKCVFILTLLSCSNKSVADYYQFELQTFEKLKQNNIDQSVFYLKIFEHWLPIPNRFGLVAHTDGKLEFNSLAGTYLGNYFAQGFIRVGKFDSKSDNLEVKYDKLEYISNIENIEVYRSKRFKKRILITDKKQKISIFDQNDLLWKAMLNNLMPVEN